MVGHEATDSQSLSEKAQFGKPVAIIRSEGRPTAIHLQLQFQKPTGLKWNKTGKLFFFVIAVVCGLYGNSIWQFEREFDKGAFWLWAAFCIWLFAEAYDNRARIAAWWSRHDRLAKVRLLSRMLPLGIGLSGALLLVDSMSAESEAAFGLIEVAFSRFALALLLWVAIEAVAWRVRRRASVDSRFGGWIASREPVEVITEPRPAENRSRVQAGAELLQREFSKARVALVVLAAISSVALWQDADDNLVGGTTIVLWFINAGLWASVFAPAGWDPIASSRQSLEAFRRFRWTKHKGVLLALGLIMILGASFRFTHLHEIPREMFVDHIEKIHDSWRVSQGQFHIFYPNNGGREPIHMHLIALLARLPGFGFDYYTLKFLSGIISLLTLPFLYRMGIELFGEERRELGIAVGLILAGLVAASFSHVYITREGLRFVMPPLFSAVFIIYAARAARRNRRSDFVKAGLVLGFGMYAYQSLRIMPLALVAIIAVALLVRQISWRERARYVFHLAVAGLVAFMVFLPMFRFMLMWPQNFWERTTVSMAGYGIPTEELPSVIVGNLNMLMRNIRDALLMYNWRGDPFAWRLRIESPEMDILCGTFLILGLAAWLARMLRSRDPVIWAMPLVVLIMLLPSALAVANPGLENPNFARASGAIPFVYLVAALPFGVIAARLLKTLPRPAAIALAALLFSGAILFANHRSTERYFDGYYLRADAASLREPYSVYGRFLRGFANSGGSFGNAFLIYAPHWWDFRILALEAGEMHWDNVISLPELPYRLAQALQRGDEYMLNPDLGLLFFYAPHDEHSPTKLREYFPTGYAIEEVVYDHFRYYAYIVPPLGEAGIMQFLVDQDQVFG